MKSNSDLDRDLEVEVEDERLKSVAGASNYQAAKKPSALKKMAKEMSQSLRAVVVDCSMLSVLSRWYSEMRRKMAAYFWL